MELDQAIQVVTEACGEFIGKLAPHQTIQAALGVVTAAALRSESLQQRIVDLESQLEAQRAVDTNPTDCTVMSPPLDQPLDQDDRSVYDASQG